MTPEEAEHIRSVGKWFYGVPPTPTEAVGSCLADMLYEVHRGSKLMHLVPRPPSGVPGWTWLVSEAVRAAWQYYKDDRAYIAVKNTVAWKFKSTYAIAEQTGEYAGKM